MAEVDLLTVGSVIIVATIVGSILRWRGISPALPLLIVGIIFGIIDVGASGPEFVLVALLAPLVFGEALSSSIVDLRRVSRPVMLLAVGLVVFGAFVVGAAVVAVVPGIPWSMAFALGAILAPTDAVAVSSTAKQVGLPRRLVQILEGESLVNDGTALTLLKVASTAALAGTVTAGEVGVILLESIFGGVIVGALGGLLLVLVMRRSNDVVVTNALIILAPFPIYLAAERLQGSGILAVVVAALILAHATSSAVTYNGRLVAASIWTTFTFLLQSSAFLLVGLEMPGVVESVTKASPVQVVVTVVVVAVALILARFLFVWFMTLLSSTVSVRDKSWLLVAWAGVRGPISILAAFTLPITNESGQTIDYRSLVITVTFFVVVVSLLAAPTIGILARRLHLKEDDDSGTVRRVRLQMARASLDRLEEIAGVADRAGRPIPADVVDKLRRVGERRLDLLSKRLESDERHQTEGEVREQFVQSVATEMMHAEQQELLRLRSEEGLPDDLMKELQTELDVRIRAAQTPHGA